jgi:hypothetical protein
MQLTTEQLKKHFHSNFDLALQAIEVARYLIKSGHEVNIAELLANIAKNPTQWRAETLEALEKAEEESGSEEENG